FQSMGFYYTLFVAFLPAVVLGVLLSDLINALLENVLVVGVMLFLGGIVFLFIDRWAPGGDKGAATPITYRKAFTIGLWQCLAMVPGVSRSAATIIGGMTQGLDRTRAAEFSFFLAVPTMFGAMSKSIFDYVRDGGAVTTQHVQLFAVGNIVAFVVAIIAIKGFIAYLGKHGFKAFGWYRIMVGGAIMVLYAAGVSMQVM
ncbi:MAG: undecaprenyl-diphosphate phosphatase, partial [Flavobacteriales bacterium]|nr:undecaprenyl-diphosphate phosphatase [Flavobacteriales bacterium]